VARNSARWILSNISNCLKVLQTEQAAHFACLNRRLALRLKLSLTSPIREATKSAKGHGGNQPVRNGIPITSPLCEPATGQAWGLPERGGAVPGGGSHGAAGHQAGEVALLVIVGGAEGPLKVGHFADHQAAGLQQGVPGGGAPQGEVAVGGVLARLLHLHHDLHGRGEALMKKPRMPAVEGGREIFSTQNLVSWCATAEVLEDLLA